MGSPVVMWNLPLDPTTITAMDNLIPATIASHTYVSDQDPNAQKNRIPTDAELALLQSLEKSHSALFQHIKEQVKGAQATHDAILARYEVQFRELEGTQSQLHESKKALQLMQDQCSTLQAESHRLSGLTHPIRRYPSDILQHIFESTCDSVAGSKKIQPAFTLSHVCQRWRAIAHDSPRLWSHVEYKMKKDSSKISSFWSHIIPKFKAVPVTIKIRCLEGNVEKRLEACNLAQIPRVERLTLCLTTNRFFTDLLSSAEIFPSSGVQLLEILSPTADFSLTTDSEPIWDIGALMKKRAVAPKVALHATCILRITPSDQLETINTLHLHSLHGVDVLLVLDLLSQLRELFLTGVEILPPPTTAVQTVSASLRCLLINVDDAEDAWLLRISCPSLTALHHAGPTFSDNCIAFVAVHISILLLDYVSEDNLIPIIAPIAPQLQTLCVEPMNIPDLYNWRTSGASGPPFPSLKELKVGVTTSTMSALDFDAIVRMYCLPVSDTGSEVPHSTSLTSFKFSILENQDDASDGEDVAETWRASELYRQATKTISEDEIWTECDNISLSWVN